MAKPALVTVNSWKVRTAVSGHCSGFPSVTMLMLNSVAVLVQGSLECCP